LTLEQRRELVTGQSFFGNAFPSLDAMRDAWQGYRDAILDEWLPSHPGERPFAMWLSELAPAHGERRTTRHWTPEHERHRERHCLFGILHTHGQPPLQEHEWEFLQRCELLTPEELELAPTWRRADDWRGFR